MSGQNTAVTTQVLEEQKKLHEFDDEGINQIMHHFQNDVKMVNHEDLKDREYFYSRMMAFIKALVPYAVHFGAAASVIYAVARSSTIYITWLAKLQFYCPNLLSGPVMKLKEICCNAFINGQVAPIAAQICQVVQVIGAFIGCVLAWLNVYHLSQNYTVISNLSKELEEYMEIERADMLSKHKKVQQAYERLRNCFQDVDFTQPDDQREFRSIQYAFFDNLLSYKLSIRAAEDKLRDIDTRTKDLQRKIAASRADAIGTLVGTVFATGAALVATAATGGAAAPTIAIALNGLAAVGGVVSVVLSVDQLNRISSVIKDIDEKFKEVSEHWEHYNHFVKEINSLLYKAITKARSADERLAAVRQKEEEIEARERLLLEKEARMESERVGMGQLLVKNLSERGLTELDPVRSLLAKYRLTAFVDQFTRIGVENVADFTDITAEDLDKIGLSLLQRRRFENLQKEVAQ